MSTLEQAQAERTRRQGIARAQAELAARKSGKVDSMGFPVTPQGGSSVDQQAMSEFKPKLRAALAGGVNGASLGLADEATGLVRGVQGALSGNGYTQPYQQARDAVRGANADLSEQEPAAYTGGQVLGGLAPAVASMGAATGPSLLGTTLRGGAIGAAEGGLYGFGSGQGVEDRLKLGAQGAGLGAVVGGAGPTAVKRAAALKNAVKDPVTGVIDGMMKRANGGKANRALASTLQASGVDPKDAAAAIQRAAQQGQSEFRLMDALGVSGQRQASGVARSGGESGAEIADFLNSRQAGQSERVGSFVDDAFGANGTTAAQTTDALKSQRSTTANAAYDAARGNAAPVDVRGALGVIDQRIGGMQGSNVTGDAIDGKLAGYRIRLAADPAPNGEISRELSDFDRVLGVKQAIQDDIGAAVRAGRNNEARELGKLATELDGALEKSSDLYRNANDGFREASKVIDSVDQGAGMSRVSTRAADNVPAFQGMTPDQQGAARVGYGDDLLKRIEAATSPTSNKAKVLQSPKRDAEAAAIAKDPSLYGERLGRENTMWETQNRALGGSRTADNIADQDATGQAASGLIGAGRSAANFQFGDAAAKIAGVLGPVAKGQTDETRQLIARMLMSSDPEAALAPVLRQQGQSDSKRRMIEAIIRSSGRAPTAQAAQGQ